MKTVCRLAGLFVLACAAAFAAEPVLMPGVPAEFAAAAKANAARRPVVQLRLKIARNNLAKLRREPNWNVVGDKPITAASKDPHDYFSTGTYWWPDPSKPDGLPYIRRDGYVNPATTKLDNFKMQKMSRKVLQLAALAFFDGNHEAGALAAGQLRAFFLAPETRMNPHLKYSQAIPGRCDGRPEGLIDAYMLFDTIDAIAMLKASGDLSDADYAALQAWFGAFGRWLETDPMSERDRDTSHNHGLAWQLMVIACAEFSGDRQTALAHARKMPELICRAIRGDGVMPAEAARPTSWDYHMFAMGMVMRHCAVLRRLGIDLLAPDSESGKRIRATLDMMAKIIPDKQWPLKQVQPIRLDYMGGLLMRMHALTGEEKWLEPYKKLEVPRADMIAELFFSPDGLYGHDRKP